MKNYKKYATQRRREIEELNKEIDNYLAWAYSKFCNVDETQLPTYNELSCKIALECKFDRKFSLQEIRNILADKSWQWRTQSQVQEVLRKRLVSFSA